MVKICFDYVVYLYQDVGNPQLSMHSIRETAGTEDVAHAIRLFEVSRWFSLITVFDE